MTPERAAKSARERESGKARPRFQRSKDDQTRGHYGTGYYGVTCRHFNLIHHAADCSLQNRQRSGGDVPAQSVRTARVKRRRCVALRWLVDVDACTAAVAVRFIGRERRRDWEVWEGSRIPEYGARYNF